MRIRRDVHGERRQHAAIFQRFNPQSPRAYRTMARTRRAIATQTKLGEKTIPVINRPAHKTSPSVRGVAGQKHVLLRASAEREPAKKLLLVPAPDQTRDAMNLVNQNSTIKQLQKTF